MSYYNLSGKNKYYTLYSLIRGDILRGKLKEGERLPSKRGLAADLGVSVVTVEQAYEQLLAEGYIRSEERSGYFVERGVQSFPPPAHGGEPEAEEVEGERFKLDFVDGRTPEELFPFSVWARLFRKVLSDGGEHLLRRVPADGEPRLKKAISDYLYRSRGIEAEPKRIVIGAGAEFLYGIIVHLLGVNPKIAVENPCYTKISSTYLLSGAKIIPLNVKGGGICPDELQNSGADAVHLSPAHQFPTGEVTPVSNRLKIINFAREGRYIIEDDYDSEFRLSGKPLQSLYSLCPDRVIYINTFSKTLAPSMRLGYMILPPALYEKFMQLFSQGANVVPLFEQLALAEMLDGGFFERHLSRLKNSYREVRQILTAAFANERGCAISDNGSGLHFVAKIEGATDDEIKETARGRGVRVKCLGDYLIAPAEGLEGCAVINYSGLTPERLKKVIY